MSLVTAAHPLRIVLAFGVFALAALTLPDSTEAATFTEVQKILAADAQGGDIFGNSVAVSGNFTIVGAAGNGDGGLQAGAAYIFQRQSGSPGDWGQAVRLTAPIPEVGDRFGRFVAISGDVAITSVSRNPGEVYVFERNQGGPDNWGQVTALTASDGTAGGEFGRSVAVDGDTIVVGDIWDDERGKNAGAAYVFQRDQGGLQNWGEVAKLTPTDAASGDWFGESVAIDGDTLVVGALFDDGSQIDDTGSAYVFQRDHGGAGSWGQLQKLTVPAAQFEDFFGSRTAIDGDIAIVGAPLDDSRGADAGAVYLFQRDHGGPDNWGELTKLTASNAQEYDEFGISLTVAGDTIAIGASRSNVTGDQSGAVYVFRRDRGGPGNWGEDKRLVASDTAAHDSFGSGVGISGDTLLIGAPGQDDLGSASGAVYVFQSPKPVGGVSLDSGLRPLAADAAHSTGAPWAAVAAVVAAAGLLAAGSAAWYARRWRA